MKERALIREKIRNGVPAAVVAEAHHLHISSIRRIVREGRRHPRKRGRPTKLNNAERRNLMRKIREDPLQSAPDLAKTLGNHVSASTIRRELVRNAFHHERLAPVEQLRAVNREKRLEFAREHVRWSESQWSKVIFTDEKKWNLLGNDAYVSVWVDNRSTYRREEVQMLRGSLMTWGAISASGGLVLARIKGKIDGETYCDMLARDFFDNEKVILPPDFIFQQDNATPHVCRHTKEFLENRRIKVLSWPPQSPDLSPIEDIWGIMSEKVYKNGKTYQNVEELWYAVVGAFFQIPQETFQKLYQSMYTRLINVLESGGKRIKY